MYTDDGTVCRVMRCQGNVVKNALFIGQIVTAVAVLMWRFIELTLRLLMSYIYIYGAPSKARNAGFWVEELVFGSGAVRTVI